MEDTIAAVRKLVEVDAVMGAKLQHLPQEFQARVDGAGLGSEDAGEMDGLVAGEGGSGGGPGVGDEAATGHAFEFSWWARMMVQVWMRSWERLRCRAR